VRLVADVSGVSSRGGGRGEQNRDVNVSIGR
jgi:hypothetical protein